MDHRTGVGVGKRKRRGRQRRIKGSYISGSEGSSDVGLRKRGKTGSSCVRKVTAGIPVVLLAEPVTLSSVQLSSVAQSCPTL